MVVVTALSNSCLARYSWRYWYWRWWWQWKLRWWWWCWNNTTEIW